MAKIVIVDGPRGAGKTTTAQHIVSSLAAMKINATYFKKGLRAEDEYQNMVDHILMFARMPEHVVVVDRFIATEFVMSTAHNRVPARTLVTWVSLINSMLKDVKALHYILLPDVAILDSRLAQREREGVTRTWDMRAELVHPLWRTAYGLIDNANLIKNETIKERDERIKHISRNITVGDFR